MYYKDLICKIPKEAIVYPNGYIYMTKEKIYKKDKKFNENKRVAIGKKVALGKMIPNDKAKDYFPEWFLKERGNSQADMLSLGAHIVIRRLLEKTSIAELLDGIFLDKSDLIKDLMSYMIIYETTISQHFNHLMRTIPLFSSSLYSDSTISRLYSEDIVFKKIDHFLRSYNMLQEKSDIYLSYDSTNINTYASGVDIAEFGHSKEDVVLPQVNISYAYDQKVGKPLFYNVYPGSIPDQNELYDMLNSAYEYGYRDIDIILDRGYFSFKNIKAIEDKGYALIMMAKISQIFIKELIDKYRLILANGAKYYIRGHDIYGMTIKAALNNEDKGHYIHLFYDGQKANDERIALLERYARLEEEFLAKTKNTKLLEEKDLLKYTCIYDLRFNPSDKYLKSYKKREDKIQKEINRLGFFCIITTKEMTATKAINIYRDRDTIEKLFKVLKNELDLDRFLVHSRHSVESKVFITFLANIIRNEIYQKTKVQRIKDKKNYTIASIINELNKIEAYKDANDRFIRRYTLTKKQKAILDCFDLKEGDIDDFVRVLNR